MIHCRRIVESNTHATICQTFLPNRPSLRNQVHTRFMEEAGRACRRFDLVHKPGLRPVVEQAYSESRLALEQGRFGPALLTSCGILDAIVTDALEHQGIAALAAADVPAGTIADWSF